MQKNNVGKKSYVGILIDFRILSQNDLLSQVSQPNDPYLKDGYDDGTWGLGGN